MNYFKYFFAIVFLSGVGLGALRLTDYLQRDDSVTPENSEFNPLERNIEDALQPLSQAELLAQALDDPEAVLNQEAEVRPSSGNASGANDSASVPHDEPQPEQVSDQSASDSAEAVIDSPAVEGTRRLAASYASLRRAEVLDPGSEMNQDLVRRMITAGETQIRRSSYSGNANAANANDNDP